MTADEEVKLVKEAEIGSRARYLLESQPFKDAISAVEAGIVQAWKDSPIRDAEGQTYLRLMMKVLTDFQGHIRDAAETGKMANIQLNHERSLMQRASAAVREFRR